MSESPVISVLMAVHNGQSYLPAAMASILTQTFSDFEFIIVNDGSTDGTFEILQRYEAQDPRIRLIQQQGFQKQGQGLTRSLNSALAFSRGKLIARMDADDLALPDRFEKQIRFLDANPECVALGTGLQLIDPDGDPLAKQIPPATHDEIETQLLNGCGALPHPTAMMRRAPLEEVRGYDESFRYAQDLDLWLRLAERGKLANLTMPLLKYRLHADAITTLRRSEQLRCAQRAVELARQRRNLPLSEVPVLESESQSAETDAADIDVEQQWMEMALAAGYYKTAAKYAWRDLMRSPISVHKWSRQGKLLMKHWRSQTV